MEHQPGQKARRRCLSLFAALFLAAPFAAHGQAAFPSKPIRLIVPTTGGTVDLIARQVAPKLHEAWGQPVVVETRAGASGGIAAAMVANSPADGYTILAGYNTLVINSALSKNVNYDLAEFAPITLAVSSPQILAVHPDVPATNLREFIALAKRKNGALNYASISPGSASHLTMELFKARAGVQLKHIPYKGAAPAVTDLLGRTVDAGFFAAANVVPFVKNGRLKALAVTGDKRLKSLPDVPSMAELGFRNFNATIWIGFLAPPGTPAPIVDKYNKEMVRILHLPDVRERIEAADFEVVAGTPQEFNEFIKAEADTWKKVAKQANVHLD